MNDESRWWKEEAERLNRLGEVAAKGGLLVNVGDDAPDFAKDGTEQARTGKPKKSATPVNRLPDQSLK